MVALTGSLGRDARTTPSSRQISSVRVWELRRSPRFASSRFPSIPRRSLRMSRLPRALLCAAVAILWSAPTSAQIAGHTIEVSGGAGLMHFDARDFAHDAPVFTGSVGWRAASWLTLEGRGSYTAAKSDTGGEPKRSFLYAGLDLRFNVRPAESRAVPYVVTGVGYG